MSKLAKFLTTILLCWFALMFAWRGYQLYTAHAERLNARQDKTPMFAVVDPTASPALGSPEPVSTMSFTVPSGTSTRHPKADYAVGSVPPSYKDNIVSQPAQLPVVTKDQQVQDRAQKVYAKYAQNPLIQAFNQDLKAAGAYDADFTQLAGADFMKIMQDNPRMQGVLIKYSQNPEFIKLLQQMMADPEVAAVTKQVKEQNRN